MATSIHQKEFERIRQHGVQTYPHECCGILLGKEENGNKVILDVLPINNARKDSPQNRYMILPEDLVASDREARKRGLDVLGFYHSHPDHPARPSEFDREHAWPWYTYLIVAVAKGIPQDLTGWLLSTDRTQFLSEELRVTETGN